MSFLCQRESKGVEVDSRFRGNDSSSRCELKSGTDFPDGILMACLNFVFMIPAHLSLFRLPDFGDGIVITISILCHIGEWSRGF